MSIEIAVFMSLSRRLEEAKRFLMKNLNESKFVNVKIYELNMKTLLSFMHQVKSIRGREKNTIILNELQTRAVH